MTAAVARMPSNNTRLVLRDNQTEFDEVQVAALHQLGVKDAERADLAVFFHQCRRTGLDPFARQIYMIKRRQWDGDAGGMVDKQTIQTGIDGFRLIARRRDPNYSDEATMWCGQDGVWHDVWTKPEPPFAAKFTVIMGNGKPVTAVAHFMEYAATKQSNQGELKFTGQWGTKPRLMIAKCAEALALRKAYPQDLSGIYTEEEMAKADVVDVQVIEAGSAEPPSEPSGRDWAEEIGQINTVDGVRNLYRECVAFGEMTDQLRSKITERATELQRQQAEADTPPPPEDGPQPEEPKRTRRRSPAATQ